LSYLHEQVDEAAEIIPGVIHNPNLSNRAEVILIVTGLGGMPIEKAIPGAEKYLVEVQPQSERTQPRLAHQKIQYERRVERDNHKPSINQFSQSSPKIISPNLDVPAFLRKRIRGLNG